MEGNSPLDIELFIILVKGTTRTFAPKTNCSLLIPSIIVSKLAFTGVALSKQNTILFKTLND